MKKAACAVLILITVIFLVNPSASEVRGGYRGGHGGYRGGHGGYRGGHGGYWGGHWGWWGPLAVVGGAAVLAPYLERYYAPYYPPYYYEPYYYYKPYYAAPPVVIQEQAQVPSQTTTPASASAERIFIYPRQGQTEKQQATDRYECHRWAVGQTGYDPTQPPAGLPEAQLSKKRGDYQRAQAACLGGRGYTVK
ncbi:MAG: hypothetical protein COX51_00540 [Syntrophobacteraceae bacterium CG23_combo_of_CG06-09_8_20_14_all_50_8]|nr:MAG: hypothetical protein COX51_00540 [Syntrophobacteraceae bacterium CG23_combo_of_CG06-09_8_20_14_all_50_8]